MASGFHPAGGNGARLLLNPNATIDAMVTDIDSAADHVHVLFYIWQLDLFDAIRNRSLAGDGRFRFIWARSLVGEELGRVPYADVVDELTPCSSLHCPQTWTEKVPDYRVPIT
jgi:hypothetical protein